MNQAKKWLSQHTAFQKGYDIQEGPFPIPANIGEGFKFQLMDERANQMRNYIAEADRVEGKRVLTFVITTFKGICAGACHYYCKAHSPIRLHEVEDPNHSIAGYLGGVILPKESHALEFDIGIPITEAMIEEDKERYHLSEPGECETALTEKETFYPIIAELESLFNPEEWAFKIIDRT